ncbi:DUF3995 domain-containing protein [Paenibacillus sp. Soil724D2]|uniref:DUF3995 domain-containing protein n=1 Tax=Paenibacillus sp. (strain Soil724D2) TaxID=1736392 RepID=UPI000714F4B2|nr:DUF3995 domain-containing protein [Paenibacillus sp. Soil724D2]KRE34304.1 hypothetical protein ASG85_13145 [Paenibacillus sp. Soil724D2]
MRFETKLRSGVILATVLMVDGLVHLYWATGSTWPAANAKTLSHAVLNADVSFGPWVVIPLALLLFTATIIVLAKIRFLGKFNNLIPDRLLKSGLLLLSTGLFLRSLAGIVWVFGIGADPKTIFYWLNLFGYTPICIGLFIASMLVFSLSNEKQAS